MLVLLYECFVMKIWDMREPNSATARQYREGEALALLRPRRILPDSYHYL
jgi:hypothetical protein